ncbi:uncharacterized protein N7477_006398 [Penicillium maclennaniae]|uniref:uncharacterized protein n=1 Tax=Penicillium maclennaniae TaxID=1343394 RepID=UPI00254131AC|nr:uncharacterized protein N7477_006398 [Penicillium maclennaniae]KAJ5667828.1 hypothetical protein N7477_006398 [Penicillium maclennaniae]
MALVSINAPGLSSGLLYNNGDNNARVCITSETDEFDMETIKDWQDEGFDVVYLPFNGGGKDYANRLMGVKEGCGVGENYAVIAYGEAANFCLDFYMNPMKSSRLCALIAYYPSVIPDTRQRFPHSLKVLVHLAGTSVDVTTRPQVAGLQGKKRRNTKPINPGIGTGERMDWAYSTFTYEYAQPGFAEHDMEEYDHLAADIAWTRTVQTLRKGFCREVDLERRWEDHQEGKYFGTNLSKTMEGYTKERTPSVTYGPTLSGAIGAPALRRFYEHYFLGRLPPSMRIRLLSRTAGPDRVVDELYISFEHSQEIPWMLPGIPPTNKRVEIILVSIVSMRGGRLYSEHTYWDQASVLVQIGLLDPKLIPGSVQGVDKLPVVGREAARRILHEDPEVEQEDYHNRLIRRANARARKSKSSAVSQADESAAENTLPGNKDTNGKTVLENRPAPNQTATEKSEANAEDEAKTESTKPKAENGVRAATVEDGDEENE